MIDSRFLRRLAPCLAAFVLLVTCFLTVSRTARADETLRSPGVHPDYAVEIEPHLVLGDDSVFATAGYGVGARFGIPIVRNGFVPTINNNVAINFGVDFIHYDACYYLTTGCGANYLLFPVTLQWNFFVARQFSVYGEGGLFLYKGFFDDNICAGLGAICSNPAAFGVLPTFAVGGRYHFSEHVALNLRVGYPTVTLGVSFW